jgi:hypothetical protein
LLAEQVTTSAALSTVKSVVVNLPSTAGLTSVGLMAAT